MKLKFQAFYFIDLDDLSNQVNAFLLANPGYEYRELDDRLPKFQRASKEIRSGGSTTKQQVKQCVVGVFMNPDVIPALDAPLKLLAGVSSSRTALPATMKPGVTVRLTAEADFHIKFGDGTVTAAITDNYFPFYTDRLVEIPAGATHVAVIRADGSTVDVDVYMSAFLTT